MSRPKAGKDYAGQLVVGVGIEKTLFQMAMWAAFAIAGFTHHPRRGLRRAARKSHGAPDLGLTQPLFRTDEMRTQIQIEHLVASPELAAKRLFC